MKLLGIGEKTLTKIKFGDKYGKELVDSARKTGIDAAKTASKRVVKKLQKQLEI